MDRHGFKDHFSAHAADYMRYRPHYPEALFSSLAALAPATGRAWDCATGNGQAAAALARRFTDVVATDASLEQLQQAQPAANLHYAVAAAESSCLQSGSIDLITVAQALHWFNLPAFYDELRRVSRPRGVFAAISYSNASVSPEIDRVLGYYYRDIVGPCWPPERKLVEQRYRGLPFPFPEIRLPAFTMEADWTLEELRGYLGTWSASKRYQHQRGADPLAAIEDALADAWGCADQKRRIHWPLTVLAGRVHGQNR